MSFRLCLVIVLAPFLVSCSSSSRPPESTVVQELIQAGCRNVRIVAYGSTLVSEGYKAPKGTKVYPVKVDCTYGDTQYRAVFYFYRDEFGEWYSYRK
jgi:hypothetical protein